MASYMIDGSDLTDVADAIRLRGNTSSLLGFPKDFVDSIKGIPYNSQPSGAITITENGTGIDVLNYATANVNVPGIVPSGTLTVDENGTYDVTSKASVEVDVPGVIPDGTRYVTANNTYDISTYQFVNVNVPSINPTGTKNITVTQNGTVTENITNYVNVAITAHVSVGSYTNYAYVLVQPSDVQVLEVANPLNIIPKLVSIEPLATVTGSKLSRGVFVTDMGCVMGSTSSNTTYCWKQVDVTPSTARTFQMTASVFIVRAYVNGGGSSSNWDTDIAYRVHFYA